jgi:hypothetical protein
MPEQAARQSARNVQLDQQIEGCTKKSPLTFKRSAELPEIDIN